MHLLKGDAELIGRKLRDVRINQMNLSVKELAKKSRVYPATIIKYEDHFKFPCVDTMLKILPHLNIHRMIGLKDMIKELRK